MKKIKRRELLLALPQILTQFTFTENMSGFLDSIDITIILIIKWHLPPVTTTSAHQLQSLEQLQL